MEKKYQVLLSKLELELEKFVDLEAMDRMRSEVGVIRLVLEELKGMVLRDGFASELEEIQFFKLVKPRFQSLLVFAVERYGMERARPLRKGKGLLRFVGDQLGYISRCFAAHGFLYEYFKMGAVELDRLYFLRGGSVEGLLLDVPELEGSFSTVGEYYFSRFMALERLRGFLVGELEVPVAGVGAGVVKSRKGRELRWTGDSCNLVELAYGLFDCRQINNGDVDLSDLMEVFEQCFQVNLSRYFRRFTEIKRRKSMSKTRFIDQMKAAVEKRIDDGDAYVPMSMR